jgi:transposase
MTIDNREISGLLRVVRVLSNGKRRYDPASKARLIEACLDADVSIAGLALAHGINTNQLRKWVKLHQDRKATRQALTVMPSPVPAAFVPVVAASPIAQPSGSPSQPSSPRVRLKASLPNGVRLELEDADEQALSVMIEALGRCHVPAG